MIMKNNHTASVPSTGMGTQRQHTESEGQHPRIFKLIKNLKTCHMLQSKTLPTQTVVSSSFKKGIVQSETAPLQTDFSIINPLVYG